MDLGDHLDLDGFYFDDMNWGSHEERPYYTGCYCRYCEEIFRRDTGLAVPVKVDLTSLDFRRWVNWRYDKLRDFLSHITRKVKAKYPDAVIDFNGSVIRSEEMFFLHRTSRFEPSASGRTGLERRYIQLVLQESGGNKKKAAEKLGIDRRTLYRALEREGDDAGEADDE